MQFEQLSAGHGALTAVRVGKGRDMVILHSLLADRHAFDSVLPALSAQYRVTLINLPGFHGSEPTLLALMDAYVAVIEDGFQEFAIASDAVLIGNGFGGTVALAFALAHPQRVGKLVLSDAAACFPPEGRKAFATMAAKVAEGGLGAIAEIAARRVFSPDYLAAHPEKIEERKQVLLAIEPKAFQAACKILQETDLDTAAASSAHADACCVRRIRPGDACRPQQGDCAEGGRRALCRIAGLRPLPAARAAGGVPGRDQGIRRAFRSRFFIVPGRVFKIESLDIRVEPDQHLFQASGIGVVKAVGRNLFVVGGDGNNSFGHRTAALGEADAERAAVQPRTPADDELFALQIDQNATTWTRRCWCGRRARPGADRHFPKARPSRATLAA